MPRSAHASSSSAAQGSNRKETTGKGGKQAKKRKRGGEQGTTTGVGGAGEGEFTGRCESESGIVRLTRKGTEMLLCCSPSVSTSTRPEFPRKTSPDRSCPDGQPLPFRDDPGLPESLPGRVFLYSRVQTRSPGLSTDFPGLYASFAQLSGDQTCGRARCWDGLRCVRSVDPHRSSSDGRIGLGDAGSDYPG